MDFNKTVFKYLYFAVLALRNEWLTPQLRLFFQTQYWDKENLERAQLVRLNKLLHNAKANTIYYKDKIPNKLASLEELHSIPFLEKEILRTSREKLISKSQHRTRLKTSGGSTGAPVTVLKDNEGMKRELAATWRGYGWAGVQIGDRQVRFWGLPKNVKEKVRAFLIDFVCNRKRITAFGYTDDSFRHAIETIKEFKPDYFYGYASLITELARYVIKEKLKDEIAIKTVITTSEVLSNQDRKLIESAFSTRVFDEYGCGEVGTIAHECEYGNLHINCENMIVEVINEQGESCKPGELGEIVVTDLTNFSMPLIRYKVKDFASIKSARCKCKRNLPILEKVYGRQYDYLINKNNEKFHGEFFLYIAEDAQKQGIRISAIQFVQKKNRDIVVKIVSDTEDSKRFNRFLKKRIRESFDDKVNVEVNNVENISREPSGKLRVVKREYEDS